MAGQTNRKLCSSCKAGGGELSADEADYLVTGSIDGRPLRALLCGDHLEALLQDGLKVTNRKSVQQRAI